MTHLPPLERDNQIWINTHGLFSSGSTGPHHTEMATAENIFDFHQEYLNDLSYLGNTIDGPCQSFQMQFLLLWFHGSFIANSPKPNSYSAFFWEKKSHRNASENLCKLGLRKKCKPKYLIYFKSYRKLHLSVVPCLCYHCFPQTAGVEGFSFFIFSV